jgi:hypothetical protein
MAGMYPDKLTHDELVDIGRRWCIQPYANCAEYGHTGCSVVVTEISANTWMMEKPNVLGYSNKDTILIECKVSRSDFLRDKKKVFRLENELGVSGMALGTQRWYLAPSGVISKEDLPEDWGLLEVSPKGKVIPVVRARRTETIFDGRWSERNILLSVLCRLSLKEDDSHVAIRRYSDEPMVKVNGQGQVSKKKATFYIEPERHEDWVI